MKYPAICDITRVADVQKGARIAVDHDARILKQNNPFKLIRHFITENQSFDR